MWPSIDEKQIPIFRMTDLAFIILRMVKWLMSLTSNNLPITVECLNRTGGVEFYHVRKVSSWLADRWFGPGAAIYVVEGHTGFSSTNNNWMVAIFHNLKFYIYSLLNYMQVKL